MRLLLPLLIIVCLLERSHCWEVSLPPPEKTYKFLMMLPVGSKSHRNLFLPIAEALANRGHHVEILSSFPPTNIHKNVKEITFDSQDYLAQYGGSAIKNRDKGFDHLWHENILPLIQSLYDFPEVKDVYNRRKDFDLIIFDGLFNEIVYPFAEGIPFILLTTFGVHSIHSAMMGNIQHPAFAPTMFAEYKRPYSLVDRIKNLLSHTLQPFMLRHVVMGPKLEKEAMRRFPDMKYSLLEIERNVSVNLIYSHFSVEMPLPLLPSQVNIGAINCVEEGPLPKDLDSWILGSDKGVVYFSLGSITRGNTMPIEFRDIFVEAFRRLPYRFIWKYEADISNLPENVLIKSWLPQQDILAHPNVKLFITHGGLLGVTEATCHPTPLLALPIFGDQNKIAQRIENNGYGLQLDWDDLNVNDLMTAIKEVVENPKFIKNIQETSAVLMDQPESPIQRAVWWSEYVVRHKGAPKLKCPGADLSWVEFLMLDVL